MKQSSIIQLAVFYLILLLSNEGITVATNIRQTVGLRKNIQLSSSLNNMVNMMDSIDVDSFLEVQDMHGMSAEAYGTLEMIEMHKSLKEGFSFENSPILKDLKSLKEIPENKILSPSELKEHRNHVSILLEKAMSNLGDSKTAASDSKASSSGECKRTTTLTCGKHSDCRPAKHNPCKGECICDTVRINECECVAKGTIEKLEVKNLDTSKAVAHTKEIDKALTAKGGIGAALFGFVDGFLSGMASDLRTKFEDPKCDGGNVHEKLKNVHEKLKNVTHTFKSMWSHMKKVHKKVWTSKGRKPIIHSVKAFITSLVELLKEGMKYMWECPATKMLVVMVGIIAAMLIMNIVFMAAGYVVLPLIIKYAGMIMGLYFSFDYMKNKVVSLYQGTKKLIANKCHGTCKKKMIEDAFSMVGAVTEIIVMSGLDKVLKVKADEAKSIFKRFGMEFHPEFKNDMKILGDAATNAKDGIKNGWKKLTRKDGLKSKSSDVLPDDVGKVAKAAAKKKGWFQRKIDFFFGEVKTSAVFDEVKTSVDLIDDGKTALDKVKKFWKIKQIIVAYSKTQNQLSELLVICNDNDENLNKEIKEPCENFKSIKSNCEIKKEEKKLALEKGYSPEKKKHIDKLRSKIKGCMLDMVSLHSKIIKLDVVIEHLNTQLSKQVKNIRNLTKADEEYLEKNYHCPLLSWPNVFESYAKEFKNKTNIDIGSYWWGGAYSDCIAANFGFFQLLLGRGLSEDVKCHECSARQLYDFESKAIAERMEKFKDEQKTAQEKEQSELDWKSNIVIQDLNYRL